MIATEADVLVEYQRLRKTVGALHQQIFDSTDRWVLHTVARKLGLLHKGILAFDSQTELGVLADYCMYDVLIEGRNAVAHYAERNAPTPGSDEEAAFKAMAMARYTLVGVYRTVPGVGVECHDVLRDEDLFLADVAFSKTAAPGAMLATRLLFLPDFAMTTGAALPVWPDTVKTVVEAVQELRRRLDRGDVEESDLDAECSAAIIRACLRAGASEWIFTTEPGESVEAAALRAGYSPAEVPGPSRGIGGWGQRLVQRCGEMFAGAGQVDEGAEPVAVEEHADAFPATAPARAAAA